MYRYQVASLGTQSSLCPEVIFFLIKLFDSLAVHQNRQFEKALFSSNTGTGSSNLYVEMMHSIVTSIVKTFFAIVK